MSLQNLQAEFIDRVFSDESDALIYPTENFRIYENNINSNLMNALVDAYPLTHQILGENFFLIAARDYIYQYPSRSPNLHAYGEYFSSFIAEFTPANDFVYLEEVAKFEWACHEIYFAGEHAGFDTKTLESLANAPYDNLHLILHPASKVLRFSYPILDIIDLCKHERSENVDLDDGGINLLIHRRDMEIKLLPLSDAEYVMLYQLQVNMPLSVALEETLAIDPEFNLEEALPAWIKNKVIVDGVIA